MVKTQFAWPVCGVRTEDFLCRVSGTKGSDEVKANTLGLQLPGH
jgi:hypothetical protein